MTNQIAQTADVCKVMYVTLPINIDWIGDVQTVFTDLLLMLQKLFSWENILLQTQYTCYRLATQCLLRRNGKKTVTAKKIFKTNKC